MSLPTTTYSQTRWSLADLFPGPDSPEFQAAFSQLEEKIRQFEQVRQNLRADIPADEFLGYVRQVEEITRRAYILSYYPNLLFAEDTQNQTAQTILAQVNQFMADMANRSLFFDLWWKDLPEETAGRLIAAAGDYRYWLEALRHFKPHTLSEAEEKIVNIKNVTGSNTLVTLYETITNGYTFQIELNGEKRDLTRGELMVLVRQADPDLRARAYQELYRVYGQNAPILGQIYQALVRDWRNEQMGLRKYASPVAARNLMNDIPDEVVDTLLEVCQKNAGVFQRFFKLKARLLGVDRLRRYDVYAPVVQSDKQYSFATATEMVLDSFQAFDPRLAGLVRRVFADNHLDSEVRRGKRGGAFCASVTPEMTPWVLLNYQGKADDVATMAHELGHAIHSMLAEQHSILTFSSSLPLAETASTFGEMMLVDRLLSSETSADVRRDLLFRQIDDSYATIQRQAFFALFEKQAHEMVQNNASVDEIAEAYLENLKLQFGDAVEVSDEFRWEWVSIPHIYNTPFYVYSYAFGQLLVLALYQQFRREGESFKPRYLNLLATGGSKAPVSTLAAAGIDVRQASFWQGGFDVVESLVSQLEAMG